MRGKQGRRDGGKRLRPDAAARVFRVVGDSLVPAFTGARGALGVADVLAAGGVTVPRRQIERKREAAHGLEAARPVPHRLVPRGRRGADPRQRDDVRVEQPWSPRLAGGTCLSWEGAGSSRYSSSGEGLREARADGRVAAAATRGRLLEHPYRGTSPRALRARERPSSVRRHRRLRGAGTVPRSCSRISPIATDGEARWPTGSAASSIALGPREQVGRGSVPGCVGPSVTSKAPNDRRPSRSARPQPSEGGTPGPRSSAGFGELHGNGVLLRPQPPPATGSTSRWRTPETARDAGSGVVARGLPTWALAEW